jgi:hypothetical protein
MEVEPMLKRGVEGNNRSSSREAKAASHKYLIAAVQTIPFTSTLSEQVMVGALAML